MFIVIRQDSNVEQVINVTYGEETVKKWILEYLRLEMDSLVLCPALADTKNITYSIEESESDGGVVYKLVKTYKQVYKGYVYNSSERKKLIVFTVKCLYFDGDNIVFDSESDTLWNNINIEINRKVMKHMDRDSLTQVIDQVTNHMKAKKQWSFSEYISMQSESLKTFRKELFSEVAKRLRRYGKRQSIYNQIVGYSKEE